MASQICSGRATAVFKQNLNLREDDATGVLETFGQVRIGVGTYAVEMLQFGVNLDELLFRFLYKSPVLCSPHR